MSKRKLFGWITFGVVLVVAIAIGLLWYLDSQRPESKINKVISTSFTKGQCSDTDIERLLSASTTDNIVLKADAHKWLATCYVYKDDYDKANEYFKKAAELYEEGGDNTKADSVRNLIHEQDSSLSEELKSLQLTDEFDNGGVQ